MKPHQFVNNDDIKKEQSARRIESDILTYALYTDWYHLPHKIPSHPIKEYIRARTHFREKGFFFNDEKSEFETQKRYRLSDTSPSNLKKGNNFACICCFHPL